MFVTYKCELKLLFETDMHLHLCIWRVLLSRLPYIAFKLCKCYQFMHSPGIEPVTKAVASNKARIYNMYNLEKKLRKKKKLCTPHSN